MFTVFIVIVFIDDCVLIVFFLPAHYCYYSGLTVLNKDFIHDEACVLETAVMLSEISIIAGSKEILSVHHFTVLVILPMRYAPVFSSFSQFAHGICSRIFRSNIVVLL